MLILKFILVGVFGFCLGAIIASFYTYITSRKLKVGTIRIDHSDKSEPPYMFLELQHKDSVNDICRSKEVTFDVKVEDYVKTSSQN